MTQMSMLTIALLCFTTFLSAINATVQDAATQNGDKNEQHSDVSGVSSPEQLPAVSNEGQSTSHQDAVRQPDDVTSVVSDSTEEDVAKRAMGMLRLGRAGSRQSSERRAMSALRLGRRNSWALTGSGSRTPVAAGESGADAGSVAEVEKRKSMSMLRLGRAQSTSEFKDEEKKAMSALRLGRKRGSGGDEDFANADMSQLSEDASEAADVDGKRAMGMLRLGRNMDVDESDLDSVLAASSDNEKRAMGMLRLGRQSVVAPSRIDRRKSMAMLRLG